MLAFVELPVSQMPLRDRWERFRGGFDEWELPGCHSIRGEAA